MTTKNTTGMARRRTAGSLKRVDMPRTKVGGNFYKGVEWLACWMLDNVEGEEVTEEHLRRWAIEAWNKHIKRHIVGTDAPSPTRLRPVT